MNIDQELAKREKRSKYQSFDDMAREEGVIAVLEFLAYNPSIMGDTYRHTNIETVPFVVSKSSRITATRRI